MAFNYATQKLQLCHTLLGCDKMSKSLFNAPTYHKHTSGLIFADAPESLAYGPDPTQWRDGISEISFFKVAKPGTHRFLSQS